MPNNKAPACSWLDSYPHDTPSRFQYTTLLVSDSPFLGEMVGRKNSSPSPQGGWNDTMPLERTSWRIANFDRILLSWRVYELEFYDNEDGGFTGGVEAATTVVLRQQTWRVPKIGDYIPKMDGL